MINDWVINIKPLTPMPKKIGRRNVVANPIDPTANKARPILYG